MENVYIVEHIYEKDEEEEIKFIGVFSSIELAKNAIKFLSEKSGFRDHLLECFKIEKIKLDNFEWKDGFTSWRDAIE